MYRLITTAVIEIDEEGTSTLSAINEPAVYLQLVNEEDLELRVVRSGETDSTLVIAGEGEYFIGPFHGPSLPTVGLFNASTQTPGEVTVTFLAYVGRFTQDALTGTRQRVVDGALPFVFQRTDSEEAV